jgi:o-succinylbenzoate synthase
MTEVLKNIQFTCFPYHLHFRFDAGTSRGVLKDKMIYLIKAFTEGNPEVSGWGEAAPLPNLSIDDTPDIASQISVYCENFSGLSLPSNESAMLQWVSENIPDQLPSVKFAFETALLDLLNGGNKRIFDTAFFSGLKSIPINGLIWMGGKEFMLEQIDQKLEEGYECLKLKIGAIDFDQECELLSYIRQKYDPSQITLRVDANGAFTPEESLNKLKVLSGFDLHSIEQPIKQGQLNEMAVLCRQTPFPIALDEELIGIHGIESKKKLLEFIRPQFIILKPTLIGGIVSSREWINLAETMGIGWWITSALESNIGLNAIAQFTSTYSVTMPQGLGTGQLYKNNFESPLTITNGHLEYKVEKSAWKTEL